MKVGELAAQRLAERMEKKFVDRSWKEMIKKAEKKGALIEVTDWQTITTTQNDRYNKKSS